MLMQAEGIEQVNDRCKPVSRRPLTRPKQPLHEEMRYAMI